ncbi:baculoviral IAP repeat-containing protein 3-like isoform X2 [Panthera uncia]|uniref:baculoviral IAP repeat-containing protein 3-like isoform X2 n=1 Tax=Panthera uncia TaxID=29064 RepID=UPI0020FF9518|nr:baculoviral IAP repeat-containing protein 3-like isoform X2 [Panthera uncia]XP_049480049.1 baculoviral IAP repeat-containing protein 3-like isoform X2 [Panthera uncia]
MHKATSPEKGWSLCHPVRFVMNIGANSTLSSKLLKGGTVSGLKYDHSCELYRMSTFSAFPAGAPVSERSLARAGFYYTGRKDRVRCFCCGLTLDNWKQGDSPLEKHRRLYPSCSFIQSLNPVSASGAPSQPACPSSGTRSRLSPPPSVENGGCPSRSCATFPQNPVTFRANQGLCPRRTSPRHRAMEAEEARLHSFQGWPLTFPLPEQLARAGFYYLGPGDKVACFACGGRLSNWEPDDDALSEHLRHFPFCPFAESRLQDALRCAVSNRSMQTHAARSRSFCSWPPSVPVLPEQLALAGFYYMGHSDDVKCFCCDGGLRCWESGDDPWVEHAKWFPRCEYLIRIKGHEFISQIQASHPCLLEQLLSTSDNTEDENAESPIVHFGPGESSSEDAVMMNTPVVKAALEMGFSRNLVKQTIQSKILTSGENYKTVSDIVSDLLNAEDEIREEEKERATEEKESDDVSLIRKNRMALFQHLTSVLPILDGLRTARVITEQEHSVITQKAQTSLQARLLIDAVLVKGSFAVTVFKNCLLEMDPVLYERFFVQQDLKYVPTEDGSDLPVEEQLRRLQEERTCKVCLDREVSVVFIPCGHLVVCQDCAPPLRKCPICRGPIKGTVRTFLS